MRRKPTIAAIAAASLISDQLTKIAAIAWIKGTFPQNYLGGIFRIEYAENPGAFLSLGASLNPTLRFWMLTVLVGVFLGACIYYLWTQPKMGRFSTLGYALIAGGGMSNLGDRLFRDGGRVIDFLNLGVGSLRTGVFNLADVYIMGGVALLLWVSFRNKDLPWKKT